MKLQPVVWIRHKKLLGRTYYECARCRKCYREAYDACPNCGAVMGETLYDPLEWIDKIEEMDASW